MVLSNVQGGYSVAVPPTADQDAERILGLTDEQAQLELAEALDGFVRWLRNPS